MSDTEQATNINIIIAQQQSTRRVLLSHKGEFKHTDNIYLVFRRVDFAILLGRTSSLHVQFSIGYSVESNSNCSCFVCVCVKWIEFDWNWNRRSEMYLPLRRIFLTLHLSMGICRARRTEDWDKEQHKSVFTFDYLVGAIEGVLYSKQDFLLYSINDLEYFTLNSNDNEYSEFAHYDVQHVDSDTESCHHSIIVVLYLRTIHYSIAAAGCVALFFSIQFLCCIFHVPRSFFCRPSIHFN